MRRNKFAVVLFTLILTAQTVFSAATASTLFDDFVVTSRKLKTKIVKLKNTSPQKTLPAEKWNNLRTTYIPGVYCQQVDDFGTYSRQRHFYYNTKTRQMIEIPNTYYVSSTKDLGDLENDYKLYGNKTDTFTHNGKTYKIPTIR